MPELPEVEITARRIGAAVAGAQVESALSPSVNALRTFAPPLSALEGRHITGIGRRGKLFLVGFEGELTALLHLMSAGRLQLYDKRASLRDRTSRLLVRLTDGRELRLREFGTKQAAWVKLYGPEGLAEEEMLTTLGPEAWPDPPQLDELLTTPRPLHGVLRDQRVIAGIGRSWVDEILHEARLSPFKRGSELSAEEARRLRDAIIDRLAFALDHYEKTVTLPIPDKLPMPLRIHRRNGEPCPRCGHTIEAVFYEDYIMCYCPHEQTDGKLLKDRRLSRLLK
ncbi:MAG: Fpg/Nei family DNA glycosylase [Candidatus Dormibacteria bacterium]